MQDPGENKSCKVGGEEEEGGQHTTENPDEQASSQISEAENDNGNSPRESHPQDSGSQGVQGSLHSRSPVEARVVAEQAAVAPREEESPVIPGPSGDAATTARSQLLELRWTTEDPVLFRISINAFLDQLSLVMRNTPQPVFMAVFKQGRGRNNES
ncbi:hypothetical protein ACRRTK_001722 [Alexandromys fortis]